MYRFAVEPDSLFVVAENGVRQDVPDPEARRIRVLQNPQIRMGMDAVHLVAQQVDAPVVRVQIVADMAQCGGIGLAPDCLPAMKDPPVVEAQRAQVRRHAGKRALQAQQAVGRLNVDGFAILEQAVLHVGERLPEHPVGRRYS